MTDQGLEQIGVEHPMTMLVHDGGDALEAHPGIDPLLPEGFPFPGLVSVPLYEDEIPDLEEAVAALMLAVRTAVGLPAAVLATPVVVDFRVRAARPGRPGRPEVVLVTKPPDPLGRDAGLLPDLKAFVIVVVDAGPEPICIEAKIFGQEFVGIGDCLLFEVIAERKVPQHFEKCQVVPVVSDYVDVG